MRLPLSITSCALVLTSLASAQAPDVIEYTFDSSDASNTAVPGVGNGTVLAGVSFAPSTICGSGVSAGANGVGSVGIDTGYQMDLGLGDWTIGFNLGTYDLTTGLQYFFGSSSAGGFRCFSGGVAGADGIMLRTTMGGDVTILGGAPGTGGSTVVWVHDSSVPEVRGYLDGVLQLSVPQTAPGTGIVGTAADFEVLTYASALRPGNEMDNFRLYKRALTGTEIMAWSNCGGGGFPTFCDPATNNSTGVPTLLNGSLGSGVGSGLHLESNQGPPGEFGYFLVGTTAVDPGIAISNGFLCVGGSIGRYNVTGTAFNSLGQYDAGGVLVNQVGTATSTAPANTGFDVPVSVPISGSPTIMIGSTWHFQVWHREASGLANFSNGASVTF